MFSSTSSSSLSSLLLSSKEKTKFTKLGSIGSNHYSEFLYNDSLSKISQVFLSFRGEELRYSFVSHIVDAFERHGIMFFIDKDELRGTNMTNLFGRIEESNIALVLFSSRYAESSWCMDELVKIKKCVDEGKLKVISIFYNVKPYEVRERTGEFGDKFWALAKTSRPNQIKEWMEALESIPNNRGLSLEHKRSEADFIKEIVKEVERVLATVEYEEIENHQRNYFSRIREKRCVEFSSHNERIKVLQNATLISSRTKD